MSDDSRPICPHDDNQPQLRVHANPASVAAAIHEQDEAEQKEEEAGATPLHDPAAIGARALQMVLGTLTGMGKGGIRDWVGGGFHRYSTDADWLVPHFEKMQARAHLRSVDVRGLGVLCALLADTFASTLHA